MRMFLLRCPKFPRCLTADAENFDRGHSLTSLPLPPAALSSLPTASVRTGFAMTRFFTRGAVQVRAGRCGHRPLRRVTRGAVQDRRADRGVRPYGSATRGAMGGRPQGSPLRKRYKGGRGERNPPVTASPCQPPLGKGALGTGEADWYNQ